MFRKEQDIANCEMVSKISNIKKTLLNLVFRPHLANLHHLTTIVIDIHGSSTSIISRHLGDAHTIIIPLLTAAPDAQGPLAETQGPRPSHAEEALSQAQLLESALALILASVLVATLEDVVSALNPLPGLDTNHKHEDGAERERPFPSDALVLENVSVQARDVDGWEHRYGSDNDGPEEEFVLVHVLEEGEFTLRAWIETEHAAADRLEFPGGDKNEPGQFGEDSGAGTEYSVAGGTVRSVAVVTKVPIIDAIDNDHEGHESADTHQETVNHHVDHDLDSEDTSLVIVRWATHNISASFLPTKPECREG